MPHYKDGTEAQVGDIVKGVPYNTGGAVVVGEVVQITPGSDACNLIVAFIKVTISPVNLDELTKAIGYNRPLHYQTRPKGGLVGQGEGTEQAIFQALTDYGQIDHFELVHRAG